MKMTGVNAIEMPEERPEGAVGEEGEFLRHPALAEADHRRGRSRGKRGSGGGLLTVVFAVHHEIPYGMYQPAVVGWARMVPGGTGRLKDGDQILQVGDTQNPNWQDVQNKVMISPNQPLSLRVKRDGQMLPITLVPKAEGKQQTGDAGWMPKQPFVVTGLEPNMPGEQAGLRIGDEILSVDGKPIHTTGAMQTYLQSTKGTPVHIEVLREVNAPLTVTPTDPDGGRASGAIASALSPNPCRLKSCRCRKPSGARWRNAESSPDWSLS